MLAELRGIVFTRMPSLAASAVLICCLAVAVAVHLPGVPTLAWAVMDTACCLARLTLVAIILDHRRRHADRAAPASIVVDLYVVMGLVWCTVLGCGTGLCLTTGDAAACTMGSLIAMATMGAQCARLPGAPRIVALQFLLITLPLCLGGLLARDPFIRLAAATLPAYLVVMISVNRQLHRDFVELVTSRQESRQLALRCALTGLPNRRMFDRALAGALAVMHRAPPVHVLLLDLDGFKAVNDRLGHPVGDLLLKEVAARMLRLVPAESLVARIGGDEFAMLTRMAARGAVQAQASRLVDALREPFLLAGQAPISIGVSVGIARAGEDAATPEAVLSQADQALYAAKRAGKNTARWFGQAQPPGIGTDGRHAALARLVSA